jgi:hypothetical protein
MLHDIRDNRQQRPLDTILTTLPATERERFAVGYLFLSGLKPLREQLERLTEIRLLIGNTTDRVTIEPPRRLPPGRIGVGSSGGVALSAARSGQRYPGRAAARFWRMSRGLPGARKPCM